MLIGIRPSYIHVCTLRHPYKNRNFGQIHPNPFQLVKRHLELVIFIVLQAYTQLKYHLWQ